MKNLTTTLRTNYSAISNYKYLDLLGMFWVGALMISTFAGSKLVAFGPLILPGTVVVYSVTYIFSDIFTEVYGYRATRRIIWTGMVILTLTTAIAYIIAILPGAPEYKDQEAFALIFKMAPLYTIANIASYFTGEFVNSYTLAKLKILTKGRHLWVRTIGSTIVGMFADALVYSLIAFVWWFSLHDMMVMIISGWLFSVAYEAAATPLTYRIVHALKKAEGVDIYDTDTDFNPFHVDISLKPN